MERIKMKKISAETYIRNKYAAIAATAAETGDNTGKLSAVKHEIVSGLAAGIESGVILLDAEAAAKAAVQSTVTTIRDRSKHGRAEALQWVLDRASGELPFEGDSPYWDKAYPLGTHGGEDKVLRAWTLEDVKFVAEVTSSTSKLATAAAELTAQLCLSLELVMGQAGARSLGDLEK